MAVNGVTLVGEYGDIVGEWGEGGESGSVSGDKGEHDGESNGSGYRAILSSCIFLLQRLLFYLVCRCSPPICWP